MFRAAVCQDRAHMHAFNAFTQAFVARAEYDTLLQRLQVAETAIKQNDAQIRILQSRLDGEDHGGCGGCGGATSLLEALALMSQGLPGQLGSRDRSRSPFPFAARAPLPVPTGPVMTYDEFCATNNIDEKFQLYLSQQSPDVQAYVISQGPAEGRSPSAMVAARIRKCLEEFTIPLDHMAGVGLEDKVEQFIAQYQLDDKCADSLRKEPPRCQMAVLAQGPPDGTNPSAMVIGRILKHNRSHRAVDLCLLALDK